MQAGIALAQTQPAPAAPAASAPPPVSSDPQVTTATFGDWVLRCVRADSKVPKTCEIVQTLQVQNQGTIAQIAFAHLNARDPMHLTIAVPTNVTFPSTLRASVDEKDTQPVDLNWRRCLPGGCIADGDLKDETLKRWRGQADHGQLQFVSGSGQPLVVPFSFRGFAQALDALAKA